jgi:hypothetical protein
MDGFGRTKNGEEEKCFQAFIPSFFFMIGGKKLF